MVLLMHRALWMLALAFVSVLGFADVSTPASPGRHPAVSNQNSTEISGVALPQHESTKLGARVAPGHASSSTNSKTEGAFDLELQASIPQRTTALLQRKGDLAPNQHVSSSFTQVGHLDQYGWTCSFSPTVRNFHREGQVPIGSAIEAYRLSQAFSRRTDEVTTPNSRQEVEYDVRWGLNYAIECRHDRPVRNGWQKTASSGAAYNFVINPMQGVIITYGRFSSPSDSSHSIQAPRGKYGALTSPPSLTAWSDVVALKLRNLLEQGSQQTRGQIARPRLIYIFHVDADPQIVQDAFDEFNRGRREGDKPAGFGRWAQKLEVMANSPAGQTIIGSPIGLAVSKLLYEHKEWLGIKQIFKVTMFMNDRSRQAGTAFLFEIEDVRQPMTC